jgi:hypothetical protein
MATAPGRGRWCPSCHEQSMADRLLTSSCCVLHLAPTCRCICCRLPFVPRLAAAAAPVEPRPGPRGQAAWWRERQQQRWQQGDSCGSSRDCWHSRRYFTTQVCSSHWRWQGEALSGGGDARPLQSSSQLMQRGFDFPTPSLANHFVQHRLPACSAPPRLLQLEEEKTWVEGADSAQRLATLFPSPTTPAKPALGGVHLLDSLADISR